MEKYPPVNKDQFTIQFVDCNTGHVLDQHLNLYVSDSSQQVYSVCNSLKAAIENADHKIQTTDHHRFNAGYYIRNSKEQVVLHTEINVRHNVANTKTIFIHGSNFSDEPGFYNEAESVLTSELDWKPSHNLNALNDLLRGGFCVHEYEEPLQLVWVDSGKSQKDLNEKWEGKTFYEAVVALIKTHSHLVFKEM